MSVDLKRVKEIFLAAVEKADRDERATFVREACGGDEALRKQVEGLLRQHEQASDFLESPPAGLAPTAAPHPEAVFSPFGSVSGQKAVGSRIGPYKILQELGEGGMGTIYLADQEHPVKRRVALKIVKAGMDSAHVIARFEQERQALAMMDHPNIAKVLDAGTTDSGRPYFVMDLVKGIPITKYCDHEHLTPSERLELFIPVCEAVQHAHQKGIIHRDLKPSNVLIALYDGKPVPKVIDFGVAKATSQKLTERTMFTEVGQIVGTLEYMAPEQAELNNLDIDTRADIYSLGVILYELLAGSPPFTAQQLRSAAFDDMLRIIREVEPPKPSTKLSSSNELPTIAAHRKFDPKKLTKLIHGELDWIVMKCLEKERGRRYETASGLARDIRRYLAEQPVQAGPPSAGYRMRKFARRNKLGLLTSGLLGVMLLAAVGAVAGTLGWSARDRAARRVIVAEKVQLALQDAETLGNRALTLVDENPYQWEATLAQALAAAHQAQGLAEPEKESLDPALLERMAAIVARLDGDETDRQFVARFEGIRLEASESDVEHHRFKYYEQPAKIQALFKAHGIDFPDSTAEEAAASIRARPEPIRKHLVAALDTWLGVSQIPAAESQWLTAVLKAADSDSWRTRARQAVTEHDWKSLESLLGDADVARQPPAFLLALANELPKELESTKLSLLRQIQSSFPGDFWANLFYASALGSAEPKQLERAVRYCTAALALRPKNPGVYENLGVLLRDSGDFQGAVAALHKAIALDPNVWSVHGNLGIVLSRMGDLDGAIVAYRKSLALNPDYFWNHGNLGIALSQKGDLDAAIAAFRMAIKVDRKNERQAEMYRHIGDALQRKSDLDGATAAYRQAVELDPQDVYARIALANLSSENADFSALAATWQRAVELRPDDVNRWYCLAQAHLSAGDLVAYRRACADMFRRFSETQDPAVADRVLYTCLPLVDALDDMTQLVPLGKLAATKEGNARVFGAALYRAGEFEAAIPRLEQGMARAWDHLFLSMAHHRLGQTEQARAYLKRASKQLNPNPYAWPESIESDQLMGEAEALLGITGDELTLAEYREAAEKNPNDLLAHNNLAWFLATCANLKLRDPALAVKHALQAVELDSKAGNSWNTLGVAQYRAGHWKAAIKALEKSLELLAGGSESTNTFFLAMAHWQLGNKGEAHEWYDRAVTWMSKNQPNNRELRAFRTEATALLMAEPASQPTSESK